MLITLIAYSCELDNYEAPNHTLKGRILDENGLGLQSEQGASSARIKLEELSWSESPVPLYLNIKQDGSYVNTKLFGGEYTISVVEGPFYPVDAEMITLNQSLTHDFTVTPYLNVSWIGSPSVDADKKITVRFKFSRNEPPSAGITMPDLQDYRLFISTNQYVGNNNFDPGASSITVVNNDMEDQEIMIVSNTSMKYSTTYYVRVGVRVSDDYKKYNYTDIKTITIE